MAEKLMTYDQVEVERVRLSIALRNEEITLAEMRYANLPMKEAGRFGSELDRKTYMDSRCARQQAVVDKLRDEAERLGLRAEWIIKQG